MSDKQKEKLLDIKLEDKTLESVSGGTVNSASKRTKTCAFCHRTYTYTLGGPNSIGYCPYCAYPND